MGATDDWRPSHLANARGTIYFMRLIVAANTVSQLTGKIIGAGTTLVISIFLAKKFGVAGYGDFVKVTTYIAFFFLLADFGLNAVYLQKQKSPDALPALFGIRIISAIFLMFLALAILSFLPRGDTQGYTGIVRLGIILFSPAIFFQACITTANAVFQKHLRYDLAAVALGVGSILSVAVLYLLLRVPSSAVTVGSLTLIAGSLSTCLVALFFAKRLEKFFRLSLSPASMGTLFIAAVPLGLTLLFNLVYGHVDSIILTLTRTTTEVGVYGLAYKVFEIALVFPTFFLNAVYPVMLKEISDEREVISEKFISIVKKSFIFLLLISCLLSLILWFTAPFLTTIQPGFAASIPALRVLSLSLPFFFVSSLSMWALIAIGKQMLLVFIYGGAMIVAIILNAWLIPIFGYMAAAWITVISEGGVLLLSGFLLTQTLSTNGGRNKI